jgi:hypothetical protein
LHKAVLNEILEERVVSGRGRQVPRGVKRKMSSYPLRPRAPQKTTRAISLPPLGPQSEQHWAKRNTVHFKILIAAW